MGSRGPVRARFDGRPVDSAPGETLAQWLTRGRVPVLQRSIRYHRPRAPFCGVGQCTGCLVRVNGAPNVRACRYVPAPGDEVRSENAWPSPRLDLLGILDDVFPRGIDTLHGFRRPRFATPWYQRVVRRLAGYGRLPDGVGPPSPPGESRSVDLLIVGGGSSGQAAARAAAADGRESLVLERNRAPEGTSGWIDETELAFLPPPRAAGEPFRAIAIRRGVQGVALTARQVIVATGGYDGPLLFRGSDRPGVLTADGAAALVGTGRPPPFGHALVVGGGPRVAGLLRAWGDRVESVIAPASVHGTVAEEAARSGVLVHPRTLLLGVEGRSRVRSAEIAARGGGTATSIAVDAVVLAHRRLPNPQLFFQAGAKMVWNATLGSYVPALDGCQTSVPGLFTAGEAAGFIGSEAAEVSGVAAASQASGQPPGTVPARPPETGPGELEGYYRELLGRRARGKWIVCPCEDVLLSEVEEAHRRGFRGIEVIKRYTSAGTGLCQGRYCLPDLLILLSLWEGRPPSEVGYITQRPPVRPAPLAALATLPEAA